MSIRKIWPLKWPRQRGAIAIIVGLSLVVLIGFAGLVLDLGRLYVNKSELQNAADACALAAAAELTCDTSVVSSCPRSSLENAVAVGRFVAGRNSRDFQGDAVLIASDDIRFHTALSPNERYEVAATADTASKYAMCTARSGGIVPWFMGVLGLGQPNSVSATAVATLGPTQNFCSSLPVGLCAKPGFSDPDYGYEAEDWISSDFHGETLDGNFMWIDFTPAAGGTSEIRDQLSKREPVCDLRIGSNVEQAGVHQGAKTAYNTRFGLYNNQYTPEIAPPDRSGYAYPSKDPTTGEPLIAIGSSALRDFQDVRQPAHAPFDAQAYGVTGPGGSIPGTSVSAPGGERRLSAVPIIDCGIGHQKKILAMACVLMLNPMSNGANGTIYLEYVKDASVLSSACRTSGTPGSGGPLAPVLVQ